MIKELGYGALALGIIYVAGMVAYSVDKTSTINTEIKTLIQDNNKLLTEDKVKISKEYEGVRLAKIKDMSRGHDNTSNDSEKLVKFIREVMVLDSIKYSKFGQIDNKISENNSKIDSLENWKQEHTRLPLDWPYNTFVEILPEF